MRVLRLLAGLLFASFACGAGAQQSILEPRNVAIVVNEADPTSVDAGEYYREAHGIPARNVVRVKITGSPRVLSAGDFRALKRSIDSALSQDIDVVLMAWTAPYAVECNSITAAYT
ncbi:MAG TPA: TIGR03790 family protein, partial [Burkholderiales bacterium]|nr:TIGR03790 family protein [Burkholderiales bacterium]